MADETDSGAWRDDPFADLARLIDESSDRGAPAQPSRPTSRDEKTSSDRVETSLRTEPSFHHDSQDSFDHGFADETADHGLASDVFDSEPEVSLPTARPAVRSRPSAEPHLPAQAYSTWLQPRVQPAPAAAPVQAPSDPQSAPAEASSPEPPQPAEFEEEAGSYEDTLNRELEAVLEGLSSPLNPRATTIHRAEAFAPARNEAAEDSEAPEPLDEFDQLIASELAAIRPVPPATPVPVASVLPSFEADQDEDEEEAFAPAHFAPAEAPRVRAGRTESLAHERAVRDAARVAPAAVAAALKANRSPGRSIGLGVAAVVVLGAVGVYLAAGPGSAPGDGEVLVVKADPGPVKVEPKDPGGVSIPNQKKAVYERVQSASADELPSQKTLVSSVEEPVDLPKADPSDLPGVDLSPIASAEAAEQAGGAAPAGGQADAVAQVEPVPVLTPRRVHTLVVRADGTVVQPEADVAGQPQVADASQRGPGMIDTAARPVDQTGSVTPAGDGTAAAALDTSAAPAEATASNDSGIPVPQLRPSPAAPASEEVASLEQPAEPAAAPAQVPQQPDAGNAPAAATEAPRPAADLQGYYVQISSQPSQEAAQQSSDNLAARYAAIVGDHQRVIQPAEIPGKGTYYRVRLPAASKDEAIQLCTRLKSAGGSCFVAH